MSTCQVGELSLEKISADMGLRFWDLKSIKIWIYGPIEIIAVRVEYDSIGWGNIDE
jgi:hypothetical protein